MLLVFFSCFSLRMKRMILLLLQLIQTPLMILVRFSFGFQMRCEKRSRQKTRGGSHQSSFTPTNFVQMWKCGTIRRSDPDLQPGSITRALLQSRPASLDAQTLVEGRAALSSLRQTADSPRCPQESPKGPGH